jgi:hypothetical protein
MKQDVRTTKVTKKNEAEEKVFRANCVSISRGKEEIARGRVIFSTSNATLLYDPATGAVRRVSIDGATVDVIGSL